LFDKGEPILDGPNLAEIIEVVPMDLAKPPSQSLLHFLIRLHPISLEGLGLK
jgi:hypothetical protein